MDKAVTGDDRPTLYLKDANGELRMSLSSTMDGSPYMTLYGGGGRIDMLDKTHKQRLTLFLTSDGLPSLQMSGQGEEVNLVLGANASEVK